MGGEKELQTWLIDHGREVMQYDPALHQVIVHFSQDQQDPYRPIFQTLYSKDDINPGDSWIFPAKNLKNVYNCLASFLAEPNLDAERIKILRRVFYYAMCFSITISVQKLCDKAVPLSIKQCEIKHRGKTLFCSEKKAQEKAKQLQTFLNGIHFDNEKKINQPLNVKSVLDQLVLLKDNEDIQTRRSLPGWLCSYLSLPKTWLNTTYFLIDKLFHELKEDMLEEVNQLDSVNTTIYWNVYPVEIKPQQPQVLSEGSSQVRRDRTAEIEMKVFGQ